MRKRNNSLYWESHVEDLFNHCGNNLLDAYAGTIIPSSELYSNDAFSGFFKYVEACSIRINGCGDDNGKAVIRFAKNYLEGFTHEMIHTAARIYYGEIPGKDSPVHGSAFQKIAFKCGIIANVDGVHKEVKEPFVSEILEKFGLNLFNGNVFHKPLLLTKNPKLPQISARG